MGVKVVNALIHILIFMNRIFFVVDIRKYASLQIENN